MNALTQLNIFIIPSRIIKKVDLTTHFLKIACYTQDDINGTFSLIKQSIYLSKEAQFHLTLYFIKMSSGLRNRKRETRNKRPGLSISKHLLCNGL